MTTSTTRQTFRDVLAQAAAQARALLPPEVNGRIESALRLVLAGDVVFHADGTAEVGSASDPMKTYTLAGAACDCQDFAYGRAPGGWCQHKIAANLHKSVQRALARSTDVESETEVVLPEKVEPGPDNDHEKVEIPPASAPAPAPQPLPEAPASVNVRVTIAGRDCQLTLRGVSEEEVLDRLERVLERYPVSTTPVSAPPSVEPEPEKRYCPKHGTEMQLNHKEGRTWYSHRHEGQWCKGK